MVSKPKLIDIPVSHIKPDPNNPRHEAGNVTELANSIRVEGLVEPLQVRPDPRKKDYYILEDGLRRWTAAKTVLEEVSCIVNTLPPGASPLTRTLTIGLITGVHKQELTPLQRAYAYARLMDECDMTQTEVSRVTGIDQATVSRDLLLLQLTPKTQDRVLRGEISVTEATRHVRNATKGKAKKGRSRGSIDIPKNVDHFTKYHALAAKAQTMCDARKHPQRGRYGSVACGRCWETVVRADQHEQDVIEYRQNGFDVPFQPPVMTPATPTTHSGTNGRTH